MKIFNIVILLLITSVFLLYSDNEKGLSVKKLSSSQGKRWAICVGVDNYNDDNIVKLKNAVNDAIGLGKILEEKGEFDKVITIVDDYAHFQDKNLPTKANIEKKIDYILNFSSPDDLLIFSFSGHGISDDKGEGYLITQDTDINKKFETSIKVRDIVNKFQEHNLKKTLLILDACREEITQSKGIGNKNLLTEQFTGSEVAATFYSTKAGWFSYEDTETPYGVFTRFMLDGLSGKADANDDGIVTFSELEAYVQRTVNDYSLRNNRMQKPYTKIYGEKFGDIGLTVDSSLEGSKSASSSQPIKNIEGLASFKASLKADEEYSTALLSWSITPNSKFDSIVILRSKNKPIDFNLENNLNYLEGEKIPNTDVIVYKILKNDRFSITDNTLEENSNYFYKIFTRNFNNGSPVYSKTGIDKSITTLENDETIQVRLDKLKVIQMMRKNMYMGVELTWNISVTTSTGYTYLLNNRPKKDYMSFIKGMEHNFDNYIEIKLPKKETSYFDVVVNVTDLNAGIKVGVVTKVGPDAVVINNKHYRYKLNDEKTYGTQTVREKEDASCDAELTWTIAKVN